MRGRRAGRWRKSKWERDSVRNRLPIEREFINDAAEHARNKPSSRSSEVTVRLVTMIVATSRHWHPLPASTGGQRRWPLVIRWWLRRARWFNAGAAPPWNARRLREIFKNNIGPPEREPTGNIMRHSNTLPRIIRLCLRSVVGDFSSNSTFRFTKFHFIVKRGGWNTSFSIRTSRINEARCLIYHDYKNVLIKSQIRNMQ